MPFTHGCNLRDGCRTMKCKFETPYTQDRNTLRTRLKHPIYKPANTYIYYARAREKQNVVQGQKTKAATSWVERLITHRRTINSYAEQAHIWLGRDAMRWPSRAQRRQWDCLVGLACRCSPCFHAQNPSRAAVGAMLRGTKATIQRCVLARLSAGV